MNKFKKLQFWLLIIIGLFAVASISESYFVEGRSRGNDVDAFQDAVIKKQQLVGKLIDSIAPIVRITETDSSLNLFEPLQKFENIFRENGISIVVVRNFAPVYWSDQIISIAPGLFRNEKGLIRLPNGWFLQNSQTIGKAKVFGFIHLKYEYPNKNRYLQNQFANGFTLSNNYSIESEVSINALPIYDQTHTLLFSVRKSNETRIIDSSLIFPILFYLLAFSLLLVLVYKIKLKQSAVKLSGAFLILLAAYSAMNFFRIPTSIYVLPLFSPYKFAFTSLWTSLGELFVFSFFVFYWSLLFFSEFSISELVLRNKVKRRIALTLLIGVAAIFFFFVLFIIETMVMNSNISFAVFRVEEITFDTGVGFLIIAFLFTSLYFLVARIAYQFRKRSMPYEFIFSSIVSFLAVYLISFLVIPDSSFKLTPFFVLLTTICYFISRKKILTHQLSALVLHVILFTIFTLINLSYFVDLHERQVQELTAINLSNEHDLTAEMILRDIDKNIRADNSINNRIQFQRSNLTNYLERKYFGGYLRDYSLQITICDESDSLIIHPENTMHSCVPFFETVINSRGSQIPETNFYFIENLNGRITYFAKYQFQGGLMPKPVFLYIELNSKLLSEGAGFPELLLDEQSFETRINRNYSFAKYYKGELVDRGGLFQYALSSSAYPIKNKEFEFLHWDSYEHCVYNLGEGNYVIVSRVSSRLFNLLISFPYIFVFFFLFSVVIYLFSMRRAQFKMMNSSLRMRIQFSLIGLVFFALLVVGSGTVYYIIKQYRTNHEKDLIDKIRSVSVELDRIVGEVDSIDQNISDYLSSELVQISDINWIDLNIYSIDGALIATSRSEIFEKGLLSRMMNTSAITNLKFEKSTRFIHKENIGKMVYLSAYVPLLNHNGKLLGYINIPYFTKEREFRQEVTTFILAFINIYVFLMLASILIAVYIAERISEPLTLIRESLKGMQIGKRTARIKYQSDDEIGMLVAEYNSKLDELAKSADLLARSERESAWREMAKQIAHEIKNPLTPMKLNIQFLQRTNPKTDENYHENLLRISKSLIEQIDTLSDIATAFSNFAKMPRAQNELFNLSERIRETLLLFQNTSTTKIEVKIEHDDINVFADKEQFSRAIINLIKNAQQAIPENKVGHILISLKTTAKTAIITVSDNGNGIPDNLKEKIFAPNFTTKSSGAGLGLAITRNIVENFNGSISFQSEQNKGATFVIEIPIHNVNRELI